MANPQYLAVFSAIVQAGSISGAAQKLGLGKSVVSRQLAKLEEELGARLIQRSTRRLALTEIGELVLQEARQIDRALSNIDSMTDEYQQQVRGHLRVSCSMAGRRQIVPVIAEFTALYPLVKIELQLEDRLVDLIAEQVDVAIRASQLTDSSLVARKLTDNTRVVVAAPSYLERAGTPTTPLELQKHACLVYCNAGRVYDEWSFLGEGGPYQIKVSGAIQINDGSALVAAAVCGSGILMTPKMLAREELSRGSLVTLLTDCELPPAPPIYAVYPARDWLPLKTSTFINFLQEKLGA